MSALDNLHPTSNAARLRHLWPQIAQLLADGVSHITIHAALQKEGFDISLQGFRNFVGQQRRRLAKAEVQSSGPVPALLPPAPAGGVQPPKASLDDPDTESEPASPVFPATVSLQTLDQLMKPDNQQLAQDMLRYEQVSHEKRRTRT